jgi:hypothetical protein
VSRLIFAAVICGLAAPGLRAQQVPGRDLLEFPVATLADAPVLASETGDGIWNPASIALEPEYRARLSAATLNTPADLGVSSHVVSGAAALPRRVTVGLSILRADVADLIRTETDPQTIGGNIPYNTTLVSVDVAQRREHLVVAAALRYRTGQVDADQRSAVGIDAGAIADGLTPYDLRLAASTFLWRPANAEDEKTRYSVGLDGRVVGHDATREARVGYAFAATERLAREHYVFSSGRLGPLEARVGLGRYSAYEQASWLIRLGVGVHYARYVFGVAREETTAALGAEYQFALSVGIK